MPPINPGMTKKSHHTYLKPNSSKCLHYYFYFIDDQLGLCYVRVPTGCPFRLRIYFNGHNWLANQLMLSGTLIAGRLNLTPSAVSELVSRGRLETETRPIANELPEVK